MKNSKYKMINQQIFVSKGISKNKKTNSKEYVIYSEINGKPYDEYGVSYKEWIDFNIENEFNAFKDAIEKYIEFANKNKENEIADDFSKYLKNEDVVKTEKVEGTFF